MFEQVQDFLDETEALAALVRPLDADALALETRFKGWTVADIVGHLHFWNRAAILAATEPAGFRALFARAMQAIQGGQSLRGFEAQTLNQTPGGLTGPALVAAWIADARVLADHMGRADPKDRVPWAGPDMSVRSCITARQMETWAHGQAVFDRLGRPRVETDRIKNIVHLGVNTFAWSFQVRKASPPGPMPFLALTAPSGAVWTWGEESAESRIDGPAVAFAQVVAQTRHVADTDLKLTGPVAEAWMANAQCFAGPPETPPDPGSRRPDPAPPRSVGDPA